MIQEGVFITNNRSKLRKTTYNRELEEKTELNLQTDPDGYMKLWKGSIDRFFNHIRPSLPSGCF